MTARDETDVVTCFLRADAEVLLLRRSREVGSYAGAWGAVAGHAEGDPDRAARREIEEETGFDDAELARRGDPFPVVDERLGTRWIVHPYLFDADRREPELNYESSAYEWVSPAEILRREVVPKLWNSYRAVSPTIETIREDRTHGSTYLSLRAVEVLRDLVAEGASWSELGDVARELISARGSMAAVRNRVNRAMYRCGGEEEPHAAASCMHGVVREAAGADRAAAGEAAEMIGGTTVLTLSRSGTVTAALLAARPQVIVAVSQPGGEGVGVARSLADHELDVTLLPDAAMASAPPFDLVLLGCDSVLPDGTLFNKVGSRLAGLVARDRGRPVYAATSVDKLLVAGEPDVPAANRSELGDVPQNVRIQAGLFEAVPAAWIDGYLTDRGRLAPRQMPALADAFRETEAWQVDP